MPAIARLIYHTDDKNSTEIGGCYCQILSDGTICQTSLTVSYRWLRRSVRCLPAGFWGLPCPYAAAGQCFCSPHRHAPLRKKRDDRQAVISFWGLSNRENTPLLGRTEGFRTVTHAFLCLFLLYNEEHDCRGSNYHNQDPPGEAALRGCVRSGRLGGFRSL